MQRKYKVLHVFSSYGGGISSLVLNLIENRTEEFRFDTLAFSYEKGERFVEEISKYGTKCYVMPRPSECGYKKFSHYVDELIQKENYDAIHCHIAGVHAIPFENIAKKNNIACFVIHAHTTRFDSKLDRNRFAYKIGHFLNYKKTTCYMTCSDMAADYVFGKKYLKKREVYLIPNGIKKEDYSTRLTEVEKQNYQEFGISDNTKVLLHVGRFSYPKNHDFIIDIVKQLEKEKFNFIVLLVGDGKLVEEITNKIKLLQLEDKIKLLGRRFDVAQIMQFSDCVILPSLNEGLPTVVIEAQAAGTKVLVSDRVTKQCDMGLGLVEFLPIDSIGCWVSALEKIRPESIPAKKCMKIIDKKRFTAMEAGKYYCSILKKEIQNTNKKR